MQAASADNTQLTGFRTYDPLLEPLAGKVKAGTRLSFEDGLAMYRSKDVLAVGWLANYVRERMHGDITYFNVNRHINPTNVCVAACKLCAFGRKKGDPAGYTMALEEAWQTAASGYSEAVTEFHIVGGLHPDLPLEYFLDLVRGLKQRFPQVHVKAFTMVEVAYLARRAKLSIEDTLVKMREAGVDSMPGGGAEIFATRVRSIICDHKIDGNEWLDTARLAHKLGFKSNATMLYGHIENDEDRVDHLLKLRAVQDETNGFQTFIPLAFHPENTPLDHLAVTTGLTDIRQIAGHFGGLSVLLRRVARKFNRWLAVSAAKSLGLPPQRVGAHRAAFIRAHLDPHPCHICSRCPFMPAQSVRAVGRSATEFRRTAGEAPRPQRAGR